MSKKKNINPIPIIYMKLIDAKKFYDCGQALIAPKSECTGFEEFQCMLKTLLASHICMLFRVLIKKDGQSGLSNLPKSHKEAMDKILVETSPIDYVDYANNYFAHPNKEITLTVVNKVLDDFPQRYSLLEHLFIEWADGTNGCELTKCFYCQDYKKLAEEIFCIRDFFNNKLILEGKEPSQPQNRERSIEALVGFDTTQTNIINSRYTNTPIILTNQSIQDVESYIEKNEFQSNEYWTALTTDKLYANKNGDIISIERQNTGYAIVYLYKNGDKNISPTIICIGGEYIYPVHIIFDIFRDIISLPREIDTDFLWRICYKDGDKDNIAVNNLYIEPK